MEVADRFEIWRKMVTYYTNTSVVLSNSYTTNILIQKIKTNLMTGRANEGLGGGPTVCTSIDVAWHCILGHVLGQWFRVFHVQYATIAPASLVSLWKRTVVRSTKLRIKGVRRTHSFSIGGSYLGIVLSPSSLERSKHLLPNGCTTYRVCSFVARAPVRNEHIGLHEQAVRHCVRRRLQKSIVWQRLTNVKVCRWLTPGRCMLSRSKMQARENIPALAPLGI
jgi:hypothetical protein